MKLNISYPATGSQKSIDIDDEQKIRPFLDKRMSQEVPGASLGQDFAGYVFRITGGNDKEGFPMKQGVLLPHRTRLLLGKGHTCFRERRTGQRKRKSVRGCIVASDLTVISLVIVKRGPVDIPGVTDVTKPRRLGPKRASKIRRLFNLTKADDVRKYVVRRPITKEGKKPKTKAAKIQRLITPVQIYRKKRAAATKTAQFAKASSEAAAYAELLSKRIAEKRKARAEAIAKKKKSAAPAAAAAPVVAAAPAKAAAKTAAPAKAAAKAEPAKADAKKGGKDTKAAAAAAPKAAAKAEPKATPAAAPKTDAKKGGKDGKKK